MRIVGPQSFAIGQATAVVDPAAAGGNPSVACQVQNSSSYQLLVNAGGAQLSIQPFWAQTVEISNQPITITPEAGTGSGTASLTLVFLLATAAGTGIQLADGSWVESPPQGDGSLTAAAITAAAAPPGIVLPPTVTNVPAGIGFTVLTVVTIPSNARTLIISLTYISTVLLTSYDVEVQGNESGLIYRNITPLYLGSTGSAQAIVPVSGVIDSSVTITIFNNTAGALNLTMTVAADSSTYTEAEFYNGPIQAAAFASGGAGNQVLANGPARLLTCHAEATGVGTVAFVTVAGFNIIRLDATATDYQNGQFSWPPNSILQAGQQVIATQTGAGGGVQVGLTFAYP
jgi:hypothetical protein